MARMVKCKVCGNQFDRDKISCVLVSARRYAHKTCAEKAGLTGEVIDPPQKDKDLVDLEEYIMKLFGEEYINARIRKQIKEYKEQYNYSYSGMLKALIYFFEVKGNSIEKANNGIGILPYIYQDAYQYYYSLYLAKLVNQEKNIEDYKPKIKIIEIPTPMVAQKVIKLFNIDDEEVEDV